MKEKSDITVCLVISPFPTRIEPFPIVKDTGCSNTLDSCLADETNSWMNPVKKPDCFG